MSSKDLQTVVKTQKAFIKELLDRLENKDVVIPIKDVPISSTCSLILIGNVFYDVVTVQRLLDDKYFSGLKLEQILELAKKSIRLTDDNCKMRHKLEDIAEVLEQKDLCSECKDTCCTKFSEKIKNILDK